ncbi:uncharacterized protein DMENIID0001_138400 [Sergentomyia squamirostris]
MHSESGIIFSASPGVYRQRMMVAEFVGRQQNCSPGPSDHPSVSHYSNNVPMSPKGHMDVFGNEHVLPLSPRSPGNESYASSRDIVTPNYDMGGHLKRKELFTQRKQREFIPDNKKDDSYWDRRRRNNEAAKRSREKRRFNDMVLEQRVVELTKENHVLKAQLEAIKDKYNICGENLVSIDQIMATMPNMEQVLTITKRAKIMGPGGYTSASSSPGRHPSMPPVSDSPPVVDLHSSAPIFMSSASHHPPPSSHHVAGLIQQRNGSPQRGAELHHHHIHHGGSIGGGGGGEPIHVPPPIHAYPPTSTYSHHHQSITTTLHPAHKPVEDPVQHQSGDALNLSRRTTTSPYEASSGSCASGTISGDDEHCCEHIAPTHTVVDPANSLPLKLRHKSHLGDKDAASALLALQHIKQEPALRSSPPWGDGEGSSDERDSGISLNGGGAVAGEPTWIRKIAAQDRCATTTLAVGVVGILDKEEENIHLKSQLARLENEVASIKNMMILNTPSATATAQ